MFDRKYIFNPGPNFHCYVRLPGVYRTFFLTVNGRMGQIDSENYRSWSKQFSTTWQNLDLLQLTWLEKTCTNTVFHKLWVTKCTNVPVGKKKNGKQITILNKQPPKKNLPSTFFSAPELPKTNDLLSASTPWSQVFGRRGAGTCGGSVPSATLLFRKWPRIHSPCSNRHGLLTFGCPAGSLISCIQ